MQKKKDVRLLLDAWTDGTLDIQHVASEARKTMEARGMIKVEGFGWMHEKVFKQLVSDKTIKKIRNKHFGYEQYAFIGTSRPETTTTMRRGKAVKEETGRTVSVLCDKAKSYFGINNSQAQQYAQRKMLEHWTETLDQ